MTGLHQVLRVYAMLRKVRDEMEDYRRNYVGSIFDPLFKKQIEKIDWCYTQTSTTPYLNIHAEDMVKALAENWNQEYTLERDNLIERIEILSTEQLKQFDTLLDYVEKGVPFEVKFSEDIK
jgi:hypothetical protein